MLRFAGIQVKGQGRGAGAAPAVLGRGLGVAAAEAQRQGHGLAAGQAARAAALPLGPEEIGGGGAGGGLGGGGGVQPLEGGGVGGEEGGVEPGHQVRGRHRQGQPGRGRGGAEGGGGPGHGRGLVLAHVGQALDLEPLGHLEEGGEVLLVYGDLAPVHELQESLHLVIADILQKDDWVLVGRVVKHGLKVRRTGGQHDFVGFQVEAIARNGHVHEGLVVEKILEDGKKIVLVVVPAETVLLGLGGGGGGGLHCHGGGGWGGAQQLT